MKRLTTPLMAAAATAPLLLGLAVGAAAPAGATPGSCNEPTVHGATASQHCYGTSTQGWTQFRITVTCYDGISSSFVGGGTSPWANYGGTATASCGAPQRQNVSSVGTEFR